MSIDARVTKDLMETLEDGRDGFAAAADKLADSNRPELVDEFRSWSDQRARFYSELETLAASYGDDIDDAGSIGGAMHRAWMSVKDALSGDDPQGVLDAAEQGEDHAVAEYKKALAEEISQGLRDVVERQFASVQQTHDQVRALRDRARES